MLKLNLPEAPLRISRCDDGMLAVYDQLRGYSVALTPEEYVRQSFVNYLITDKHYPAGRMANEVGITLNDTSRRCDTVIYDSARRPLVIVEYKAPMVGITPKVFDQIARYNLVLHAPILIVSNGLTHYCCRYLDDGTYQFLPDIPMYREIDR